MGVLVKQSNTSRFDIPFSLLWGILGFLSIFIISITGYQKGTSFSNILKLSLLAIVLISVIVFYVISHHMKIKDIPYFKTILITAYIISLIFIMITEGKIEFNIWMVGSLSVAMLLDTNLGYLVTYNLIFIASMVGELNTQSIIYLFVIGTFLCLMSKYVKKVATIGYAIIIILSMQIILLFIINNFILKKALTMDALYSVLSSLAVICISYVEFYFYSKNDNNKLDETLEDEFLGQANGLPSNFDYAKDNIVHDNTALNDNALQGDSALSNDSSVSNDNILLNNKILSPGTHTFDEVLDTNFPLLQRLRDYSLKIYEHSLLISEISANAASLIGVNETIARVGGLYHEIGRIESSQYVESGVMLVEAYHLPKQVLDIIRQHNVKYDKPKSPEAAIVMLAISIVATKEYLEKTNPNEQSNKLITTEKIVDNVFQMRLSKGSLDESGLSLKQFNELREFFLTL